MNSQYLVVLREAKNPSKGALLVLPRTARVRVHSSERFFAPPQAPLRMTRGWKVTDELTVPGHSERSEESPEGASSGEAQADRIGADTHRRPPPSPRERTTGILQEVLNVRWRQPRSTSRQNRCRERNGVRLDSEVFCLGVRGSVGSGPARSAVWQRATPTGHSLADSVDNAVRSLFSDSTLCHHSGHHRGGSREWCSQARWDLQLASWLCHLHNALVQRRAFRRPTQLERHSRIK